VKGKRPAYAALLALLVAAGPAADAGEAPSPLRDEGEVFIYLEPFPSDANRLGFRFESLSAVKEDGTELPLTRSMTDVGGGNPSRSRLLAGGKLPPGQYHGLEIRVSAPTLEGAEGPVRLTPQAAPTRVDAPFRIRKREAVVLSLRFRFKGSVGEGFSFTPRFEAQVAVRPAVGRLALVTNRGANSVTIFDKISSEVVGVVPTGLAPAGMALDPSRERAYVAVSGEDAVIAIGLLEYAVVDGMPLRGGDVPVSLALTPLGETLLSVNVGTSTVSLIDALSLTEIERIPVGEEPRSVVIDPSGTRAFVFNSASSSISVIDLRNRRPGGTISTEAGPFYGQFNRAGDALYVIHRFSSRLSVVDPTSLRVTNTVYVGPGASALTVDPRSDLVYLGRRGTGQIEIFDPLALLPVDSFPVDDNVSFMTLDVEQNYLYLVLPDVGEVDSVEVVGNKLRGRTDTGDAPVWVVVNGEK
jgi:YVTN family beta-propeller protein